MRQAKALGAKADLAGVLLSVGCMIHCIAFPFLIALAPAWMRRLPGDDTIHRYLAAGVLLIGCIAFRAGYKIHRRRRVLGLFVAGIGLLLFATLATEHYLTVFSQVGLTICGSILVVAAHLWNRSFCRTCVDDSCHSS